MSGRRLALWTVVLVLAALGLGLLFQELTRAWIGFGLHPEVLEALERSLDDQRQLARLRPDEEAFYRERFGRSETLLRRLRILEHNRSALLARYRILFGALLVAAMVTTATVGVVRGRRRSRRLARLGEALADLAAGRGEIRLDDSGRDLLGRIARMVEETSRRMLRDRRRLASLENLSAWQEAARRHAHEMRTPLTGARLELERLERRHAETDADPETRRAVESAGEELERLGRFIRRFTSFARLPRPSLRPRDLGEAVAAWVDTYREAWPELELVWTPPDGPVPTRLDGDMLRQVLVNLADNAAHAVAASDRDGPGTLRLAVEGTGDLALVDVADDGPGIPIAVERRLFEPYTTTREVGEGMGLGLSIARKILLDHGGDLELRQTSPAGAAFRLTFPLATSSPESAP